MKKLALLFLLSFSLFGQTASIIPHSDQHEDSGFDKINVQALNGVVLFDFTVYDDAGLANGNQLGIAFPQASNSFAEFVTYDDTGNLKKWGIGNLSDSWSGLENAFYIYQFNDQSDGSVELNRLRILDNGNMGVGVSDPIHSLDIDGALKIADEGSKPSCAVAERGTFWHDFGGSGVKDTVEICAKDAGDAYAWRVLY